MTTCVYGGCDTFSCSFFLYLAGRSHRYKLIVVIKSFRFEGSYTKLDTDAMAQLLGPVLPGGLWGFDGFCFLQEQPFSFVVAPTSFIHSHELAHQLGVSTLIPSTDAQ